MSFVVGETIGPYQIVEKLGQGGMATVFKAYHASLDRYVAIKALHPAFKEDPNFLARFQREARLVARLEHTNIVPIYDFAEHEGRPYLVMKFIEGETLKARMGGAALSQVENIQIMDAVGAGLAYAHRQGILHRDVKPSNVLLAKDGQIYLADFGLARIAQAGESTLSSDMMLGTPQYISPEQALGKKDLDERTDIYSLGVMLYEMLVGRVPFSADTPYAIIHDHIYTPLPLPHILNPAVSEPVERVLLRALAKERDDRFTSVTQFIEAFKKAYTPAAAPSIESEHTQAQVSAEHRLSQALPGSPALEAVIPESREAAVQPGTDPASTTVLEPAGEVSLPDGPPRSSRKPRGLTCVAVPAVVVFILFCCMMTLKIQDRNQPVQPPVGNVSGNGSDHAVVDLEISTPLLENTGPTPAMPEPQITFTLSPGDSPYIHLDRAVDLARAQRADEAKAEFQLAMSLGGTDADFYEHAARRVMVEGYWIQAAFAAIRMAQNTPGELSEHQRNLVEETVYRAFDDPTAHEVVNLLWLRDLDPILMRMAEARQQLSTGYPERAQAIVNDQTAQTPNLPLVRLMQAQVWLGLEQPRDARPLLESLLAGEDVPEWIRLEADSILSHINN